MDEPVRDQQVNLKLTAVEKQQRVEAATVASAPVTTWAREMLCARRAGIRRRRRPRSRARTWRGLRQRHGGRCCSRRRFPYSA